MAERRGQDRGDIDVVMNAFNDGIATICVAQDISPGGIRIRRVLEHRRSLDERYLFEFQLPGDPSIITARGRRVRNRGEREVAVRFTEISPGGRERIAAYVAQRG